MKHELLGMFKYNGIRRRDFLKGIGCLGLTMGMGMGGVGCEEAEDLREPYVPVMDLTDEEMAALNGEYGLTVQKVMETLVRYGDIFGADRLVPIEGPIHVVGSFGMLYLKPYFNILKELSDKGLTVNAPFTADPRPPMMSDFKDLNIKGGMFNVKAIVFSAMYMYQNQLEQYLGDIGMTDSDGFTCTCYLDEVGNTPKRGQILSWAESSAVSYANSVIGARTNRNSAVIEIFGGIMGRVPNFGLLLDENRTAPWHVHVETTDRPEAQVLGSAIGMKVLEDTPYITGLDAYLGTELDNTVKGYLKDMGAAAASNGAVGLYHVENLTPEAVDRGRSLLDPGYRNFVVDDRVMEETMASYPVSEPWQSPGTVPDLCFIGCPHLTLDQLYGWTERIVQGLADNGETRLAIHTVLTASPQVLKAFKKTSAYGELTNAGAKVLSLCPLMYMGSPAVETEAVLTNSNKLRTYTTARYATDKEVLEAIVTGGL